MPRKRVLDPRFWTDDAIIELCSDEKLFFIGFWSFADDRGIHKNKPKVLKIEIFPANDKITADNVQDFIKNLLSIGLLQISEDKTLLRVTNWDLYQKIQHKTPSKYEDDEGNIIIPFIYQYDNDVIEVSHNINNINNIKQTNISDQTVNNDTNTTFKPTSYKDKVNAWYDDFKSDEDKIKRFNDTFPDIDVNQKLTECYSWLLNNVRKNKDKTFFNWCSNHSGKVSNKQQQYIAEDFKLDTSGNARMGYCSQCYRSDFYSTVAIHRADSKCCGVALHPVKETNVKQVEG